eukprot:7520333-Ditylum_brightwellii.AAC.1
MLSLVREASDNGISTQALHSDNGTFSLNKVMAFIANKKQSIRFRGMSAAHQNAVAERAIQTATYMIRTMLIHASMITPGDTIAANH